MLFATRTTLFGSMSYVALEIKKSQDPKRVTFTQIFLLVSILYAQTGQYVPQPLLHQSWSTGLNEKQFNSTI